MAECSKSNTPMTFGITDVKVPKECLVSMTNSIMLNAIAGYEAGGELYGNFSISDIPVVQAMVGPGPKYRATSTSFYQDIDYMRETGGEAVKMGLCHIGGYHSHHSLKLDRPSGGDKNTVWNNFPDGYYKMFIMAIGNIDDSYVPKLTRHTMRGKKIDFEVASEWKFYGFQQTPELKVLTLGKGKKKTEEGKIVNKRTCTELKLQTTELHPASERIAVNHLSRAGDLTIKIPTISDIDSLNVSMKTRHICDNHLVTRMKFTNGSPNDELLSYSHVEGNTRYLKADFWDFKSLEVNLMKKHCK